jgi:pimeloyl-ACP methyl ester carboxylesterase
MDLGELRQPRRACTALRAAEVGGVPLLLRAAGSSNQRGLVVLFDPGAPESREALASRVPLPRVSAWKAYLGLPLVGYRQPQGGVEEIARRQRSDYLLELLGPAVHGAVRDLPVVVSGLRRQFDLAPDAPLGLVGVSAGGLAALLALADRPLPIAAAVIVAAAPDAEAAVAAAERAFAISYRWTAAARACAKRLDIPARASDVARDHPAVLVVRGADDDVVSATAIDELQAALQEHYASTPGRLRFETPAGVGHGIDDSGVVADLADEWLSEHLTNR